MKDCWEKRRGAFLAVDMTHTSTADFITTATPPPGIDHPSRTKNQNSKHAPCCLHQINSLAQHVDNFKHAHPIPLLTFSPILFHFFSALLRLFSIFVYDHPLAQSLLDMQPSNPFLWKNGIHRHPVAKYWNNHLMRASYKKQTNTELGAGRYID